MIKNPQTEELKESSSCAIPLIADVTIDNNKGLFRVQSTLESTRNMNNTAQNILLKALGVNTGPKIIGG